MSFTENLTRLMRRHGLTQTSLGQKIGVSQKAVSKWQAGDTRPGPQTAKRLAEELKVPVEVLMGPSTPFETYLTEIRTDAQTVKAAYPDNQAAAEHALDYLQQKRIMAGEAERLRGVLIQISETILTLDPRDDVTERFRRELIAAAKLADLKRRAAAGEVEMPPLSDRGREAS